VAEGPGNSFPLLGHLQWFPGQLSAAAMGDLARWLAAGSEEAQDTGSGWDVSEGPWGSGERWHRG